ncbi:MAG: hypothetical protein QG594_2287 [Bacteroidota bacterium]|jgi:hypothetical protein|nr:hypothetical protein [Bacteroidota bacterium]
MQKIHFSKFINAPKEKVWDTMLSLEGYKAWTAPFCVGSYFVGDWSEGSEMKFLGPNPETGKEGGMYSRVRENRPHEFVSVEHLGFINEGVVDTTSEEVKKWTPAFENYTFVEKDGGTEVLVDMDINEEMKTEFEEMWSKALDILKNLSETA